MLHGYNVAQENHNCFNTSKWYFLKYKIWQLGLFLLLQSHMKNYSTNPRDHYDRKLLTKLNVVAKFLYNS